MTIKNELLHSAVVRGELPTVRRLLDRHRADINMKNSNDISCLQMAILSGHTKLAEFLIQKGIDIKMVDPEGFTALHDAALVGNVVLVKKLISKGLSPLSSTKMGELVIDLAGNVQTEKVLCEEIHKCGELELARQYYVYLGINQMEAVKCGVPDSSKRSPSNRGSHSYVTRSHQKHLTGGGVGAASSPPRTPRAENKTHQTKSQVSKNFPTCKSRVHPSAAKTANSALSRTPPTTTKTTKTNHSHGDGNPLPDSNSSHGNGQTTSGLGPIPNYGIDDTESHKNVRGTEAYKSSLPQTRGRQRKGTDNSCSDNSDKPLGDSVKETATGHHQEQPPSADATPPPPLSKSELSPLVTKPTEVKPSGNLISLTKREYIRNRSNSSPEVSREQAAIKALHRHSNFQLQIGLSLQSEQFSSILEQPEQFSLDPSPPKSLSNSKFASIASSPCTVSRRNNPSGHQNQSASTGGKKQKYFSRKSNLQQNLHRPLCKSVSFVDLPMTRSKAMFVGPTNSSSDFNNESSLDTNTTEAESKERTRCTDKHHQLTHSTSLPSNILTQFISRYKETPTPTEEVEVKDETDGMFDAGIRALSLKPRKSSIASSVRRRRSEEYNRRRSVTFQPEVLLQEIVTDGDVKAVSAILESGMIEDVNKMSPSGLTALHQSAIDGNLECAKTLVANGANVNCVDCESWTPLHAAVMNGSLEFVRFLLSSGAKPGLKNDNGETPYDMAKVGPIRKMLLHTMNGKSPDANDFSDGEYSGGEEEEEYSGAESESDDDLDVSGLFDSSGEQKTSLKERLGLTHTSALNNNTSSISPSPDLDNVFSSGSQVQYQKREQELTDSTSSYGSLFEPDETIKRLDKQYISENGEGAPKVSNTVESDTDKISESGISTMEGSSDNSHRSRVLSSEDEGITLDSDLDPESLDYEFQEACLFCDVDRVLKLVKVKYDIEVNRVNKTSGITALHHSVLEENFALVQHLVNDFEADLQVRDIEGWTPLHAASAVGSIQIAQFLIDRGAKPSSLNLSCEFPVDVAEDEAMEKLLKNAMLGHSSGVNR